MEGVAEQGEAGERAEAGFEFGDAGGMADGVLRQRVGPAADDGERRAAARAWVRGRRRARGVEDAGEFEAGDGGDLVVVAAGDAVGGGASEEGADEAAVGRDAVGELLVGEGAGEQEAAMDGIESHLLRCGRVTHGGTRKPKPGGSGTRLASA